MNEIKERSGSLSLHMWEIEPVPTLPHQEKDHKRKKLDHEYAAPQQEYRSKFESLPGYRPPESAGMSSSSSLHPSSSSSQRTSGGTHGPSSIGGDGGIYGPASGHYYSSVNPSSKDGMRGKKSKKGSTDSFLSQEDAKINAKRANRFKNDAHLVNQRPPSPLAPVKVEPGTILTEEDFMKMKIIGTYYALIRLLIAHVCKTLISTSSLFHVIHIKVHARFWKKNIFALRQHHILA